MQRGDSSMWKTIEVDTSVGPVGAIISGVDLSEELDQEVVSEIHQAWLKHHIVFSGTRI